jgi:DNA repair exonuclease SbcCD ATPase subunit
LREHAAKAHNRLDEIRKALETLASQTDEVVAGWRKSKDESSWKQSVDAAAQAYQELRENLAREEAGDPAAYGEFVQRRQAIEQRLKELDERKKQVQELKEQAGAHLHRLVKIRRELTESRRKFLNDVLSENRYVRIQVVPYGARETVEGEFRRLLQREDRGFEKDIGAPGGEGLLGELYRNSNGIEDIEQNLANIKNKVRKIASDQYDAGTVADRRFATHIGKLQPEVIDRLDLWFPEDSLNVQYSSTGDGQHFRSIQEGSPGQKTAALLAFLLSYGEEPLILDQPEDDLDNHLIYDLIVTQLREVKCHRQVVVVTHNANIVVNGDAELVVALAARGGETQKECEGSLQERLVRQTICTVMEGGSKAFEQRYRRIALEGRHV